MVRDKPLAFVCLLSLAVWAVHATNARANRTGSARSANQTANATDLSLAVGLRYWGRSEKDIAFLLESCGRAAPVANAVVLSVNVNEDASGVLAALQQRPVPKLIPIPVTPWKVSSGLNAIVWEVTKLGSTELLLHSVEVVITPALVRAMRQHLDADTLVVGAKLDGHQFRPGRHRLDAVVSPWNTLALWRVSKLAGVGFLTVADGISGMQSGMEEVSTISAIQILQGRNHCRAKLVDFGPISWRLDNMDPGRLERHRVKMQSKNERTDQQMQYLGIDRGWVDHVSDPL